MRLKDVRRFLQEGVFLYNPESKKVDPFVECLKKIRTSQDVYYQDRLGLIDLFKERVLLLLPVDTAEYYLSLADAHRQDFIKKQANVEKKIHYKADLVLDAVSTKQAVFIEHLVLDSLAKQHAFKGKVTQNEAILFYHRILEAYIDYRKQGGLPDVSNLRDLQNVLWQAFRFSFSLGAFNRTHRPELKNFFLEFEYQLQLMKEGKEDALPYLLIPIQERDRAMIAKIDWNKEDGFSWVLVNTGQDAICLEGGQFCMDLRLERLNIDQLKELVRNSVHPKEAPGGLYDRLLTDLRLDQVHSGRRHHLHQGVSSESKSLASAIHGILGTALYREFKFFLTRCLTNDQPQTADLVRVIERRKWKMMSHRQ